MIGLALAAILTLMYSPVSFRNYKIVLMLVDLDYHLWYADIAKRRISILKGDKLKLQEEIIKLKGEIYVLQGNKADKRS